MNGYVPGAIITEIKFSRIDITADFSGELPPLTPELSDVVTRAKKKDEHGTYSIHAEGKDSTGYTFGGKELKCRFTIKRRK
jgi:hypothetical protein